MSIPSGKRPENIMKHIVYETRSGVERWLMVDDDGSERELFRREAQQHDVMTASIVAAPMDDQPALCIDHDIPPPTAR